MKCPTVWRGLAVAGAALLFLASVQADPAASRAALDDVNRLMDRAFAATDPDETRKVLGEVLDKSASLRSELPDDATVWAARAVAALQLEREPEGREAAAQLKRLGAADSKVEVIRNVFERLKDKGWARNTPPAPARARKKIDIPLLKEKILKRVGTPPGFTKAFCEEFTRDFPVADDDPLKRLMLIRLAEVIDDDGKWDRWIRIPLRGQAAESLTKAAKALLAFAAENDGRLPDGLDAILTKDSGLKGADLADPLGTGRFAYPGREIKTNAEPHTIILHTALDEGRRLVILLDGSLHRYREGIFQTQLKQPSEPPDDHAFRAPDPETERLLARLKDKVGDPPGFTTNRLAEIAKEFRSAETEGERENAVATTTAMLDDDAIWQAMQNRISKMEGYNRLRSLGVAIRLYSTDHEDKLPASLEALLGGDVGVDEKGITDPFTNQRFTYVGQGLKDDDYPMQIVMYSALNDGQRVGLLLQGTTFILKEPEFQKQLREHPPLSLAPASGGKAGIAEINDLMDKAFTSKDPEATARLLEQVLSKSEPLKKVDPTDLAVWAARGVAALQLGRETEGREAGENLRRFGAATSDKEIFRNVLKNLEDKGWKAH